MKYVLKQQWIARKNAIGIISLIIAVINILGVIANHDGRLLFAENKSLFQIWVLVILGFCIFSYQIMSLCINIKSFKEMYFKDTRNLMLTLPIKSYELLGGKILFSVFEFVIYLVQIDFWLSIQGALIGPDFIRWFFEGLFQNRNVDLSNLYFVIQEPNFFLRWFEVLSIIFKEHFSGLMQLVPITLITFTDIAIVIDLGLTILASLRKKALPRILSALFIFIIADVSIRIISIFTKNYEVMNMAGIWYPLGIATALAAIYFVVMCYLFEKRIEA